MVYCQSLFDQARENTNENTVFMILGNKSDLESVVTTEQGHEFALSCGAIYLEVSARNNDNIENAFEVVATEALKVIENI